MPARRRPARSSSHGCTSAASPASSPTGACATRTRSRSSASPAYHHRPSPPTNLTLHHAIEINGPIGCGDAPVFPGDVIVGDAEGVVVIPAHLADEVATEAVEMTAFEDFVAEKVAEGRSILGLYPATEERTRTDFAAWRKAKGR
jgi:regulator of RNase E activity RraA